jgi:hypothetical protein
VQPIGVLALGAQPLASRFESSLCVGTGARSSLAVRTRVLRVLCGARRFQPEISDPLFEYLDARLAFGVASLVNRGGGLQGAQLLAGSE